MPKFDFVDGYQLENKDFINGPELFALLKARMIEMNGVGLAAPQIGIFTQAFVFGDPKNEDSIIPVFNPSIVSKSKEMVDMEEGCLSFPGLFIKIKRASNIRARFANYNGVVDTANFTGLSARIFLHEYDHLYGKLFTFEATRNNLDKAYAQQKKLNRLKRQHENRIREAGRYVSMGEGQSI